MGGTCSTYGEDERCIQVLVGKTEGMRPLGRPRRRWKNNINMDLQEVGWGAWTEFIWLRIGQMECGKVFD
jgi:hypothetical protein